VENNSPPKKFSLALCPIVLGLSSGTQVYEIVNTGINVLNKHKAEFKYIYNSEKHTVQLDRDAKIRLLSIIFNANNTDLNNLSTKETVVEQVGLLIDPSSEKFKKELADPKSSLCILSQEAVLRSTAKINVILENLEIERTDTGSLVNRKSGAQSTSTKINTAEFWEALQKNIGDEIKEIEAFFSFLILSKSKTQSIYTELANIISKNLYGTAENTLADDTDLWKSDLDAYQEIIRTFTITETNLTNAVRAVFKNAPKKFKVISTDEDESE
jgi:hypothetical protein